MSETPDSVRIGALTTHAAIEDGKVPDLFGGLMRRVAGTDLLSRGAQSRDDRRQRRARRSGRRLAGLPDRARRHRADRRAATARGGSRSRISCRARMRPRWRPARSSSASTCRARRRRCAGASPRSRARAARSPIRSRSSSSRARTARYRSCSAPRARARMRSLAAVSMLQSAGRLGGRAARGDRGRSRRASAGRGRLSDANAHRDHPARRARHAGPMTAVTVELNGAKIADDVEPRETLADFLRDRCGLTATHLGCEHGACGACTVVVDGKATRSCLVLAVMCDGRSVADAGRAARRSGDGGAAQAFPRMPRAAMRLLHARHADHGARHPAAPCRSRTRDTVRHELSGQICRCTGYADIVKAIVAAGQELAVRPTTSEE